MEDKGYKIKIGYEYIVHRQDFNGKVFYKIKVGETKSKVPVYKNVSFSKNGDFTDELENNSKILINDMYENFYVKKEDTRAYNPIFSLIITDWVFQGIGNEISESITEYSQNISTDELPF